MYILPKAAPQPEQQTGKNKEGCFVLSLEDCGVLSMVTSVAAAMV